MVNCPSAAELSKNKEYCDGAANESFTEQVSHIRGNIDTVQSNITQIKTKQLALIDSPVNQIVIAPEVYDTVVTQTKELLLTIRQQLQKLDSSNEQNASGGLLTIRKEQHTMLTKKYVLVLNDYNQTTMIDFLNETKQKLKRQLDITCEQMNEFEQEEMTQQGDVHGVFAQHFTIADPIHAEQSLADIDTRHSDIVQLESSIQELRNKFQGIALLVGSQGDVVSRIEDNVFQAEINTTLAMGKLLILEHDIVAVKQSLVDDIKTRHNDIVQLESSIQELHNMIQGVALLVGSQGDVVNRIEDNVFQAEINTALAMKRMHIMAAGIITIGFFTTLLKFIL